MAFVSITRIGVKTGSVQQAQQVAERYVQARRELLGRDVQAMYAAKSEDGTEWVLVSVWASTEANQRHENDAIEQEAIGQLGSLVSRAPEEFEGTVVAALP